MKIETLMWSEIKVTHINPPKRKGIKYEEVIWENSTIRMIDNTLYINEYTSVQGTYTGKSLVLAKPKLTHLQPWCMIFEAEWIDTFNIGTSKEKTFKHKVAVSAKF